MAPVTEENAVEIQEALETAASSYGFVVVGVPTRRAKIFPGEKLYDWGGCPLPGKHSLHVVGRSNREEWIRQWQLLFGDTPDPNQERATERFFRCVVRVGGTTLMKRGDENGW